jgi:uncharacterized protein
MLWLVALLAGALWMPAAASTTEAQQQSNTPFPIPDQYKLVNDYLGVLRISTSIDITKKLQTLERRNGTQIVFLSVPSTGNATARAYADAVFEKWDIGNNRQGNGVLFLVTPERVEILTGPGIAGALPDIKVAHVIRDIITPAWQREEYSEGTAAAIDAMIAAAWGEDTAPTHYDYLHPHLPTEPEHLMIAALALFGSVYVAVLLWYRHRKRKQVAG